MDFESLVSVYIPTHNRCDLLKRAVNSVLDQSYNNIELIVVNDGSSDGTQQYLEDLAKIDSRLKIVNLPTPKGACFARNLAVFEARGQFITGLDDDDFFTKDRIKSFVKHSNQLEQFSFISSATIFFHGYEPNLNIISKAFNKQVVITLKELSKFNAIGNQIFTYTERVKKLGGFDVRLSAWQDYDMWLRLVEKYGPGKNLLFETYYMDLSPDRVRISTSKKKLSGIKDFLNLHSEKLSLITLNKFRALLYVNKMEDFRFNFVFIFYFLVYRLKGFL
ncbi:glycosyltransferase [Pseudoalteromonas sp.]|uniref:glycosyltransferase n=1 Tax=Pseudoalteromonas sp. TaxID=53249 RepID=UPI0035166926